MYERFAIFQKLIALDTGKVENFALTACALHIFLRTKCQDMYMPTGSTDQDDLESNTPVDVDWRIDPYPQGNVIRLSSQGGNRTCQV